MIHRSLGIAVLALATGCASGRPSLYPTHESLFPQERGAVAAAGEPANATTGGDPVFEDIGYSTWSDDEPPYRIYPGDEIEVTVPSAPELSKTLTVQPDGRVSLPLIHSVMVADRTPQEVEAALTQAYSSQLIRPEVLVGVKTATPLRVFVGGEVDKPGVYDMPGDINALQAVIQAGGFKTSASRNDVIIIRRGLDGRAMARRAALGQGIRYPSRTDLVPLKRFDIVYVPRSGLAKAGVFMGQLRDILPGTIGFNYALNDQGNTSVTDVVP